MNGSNSYIGKQIGNYRVVSELASGAFGHVYLAQHTLLMKRTVAIKLLHATHLGSSEERESFLQEAQFLEVLKHPYILPILDVGIDEGFAYIVAEYAQNGSLRNRLRHTPGLLPLEETLTIVTQIGQALQYAHEQHIIHRDLKPENILFNARNDALLADFGIATTLDTASIKFVNNAGTPRYMAPEQFQGSIAKESDQYSLGCIAFELMTGRPPFLAQDFFSMGFMHLHEPPVPPTQLNPHLSPAIEYVILKAMSKQRTNRYPDMFAFITALQAATIAQLNTYAPVDVNARTLPPHNVLMPPQVSTGGTTQARPDPTETEKEEDTLKNFPSLPADPVQPTAAREHASTGPSTREAGSRPPALPVPSIFPVQQPASARPQYALASIEPLQQAPQVITDKEYTPTLNVGDMTVPVQDIPVPTTQKRRWPLLIGGLSNKSNPSHATTQWAPDRQNVQDAQTTGPRATFVMPGNTPGSQQRPPKRSRRSLGLIAVAAIALLLLTFGGGVLAFSGLFPGHAAIPLLSNLTNRFHPIVSNATVKILPASKDLKKTYSISVVTGTALASQQQVTGARTLQSAKSGSLSESATGTVQVPATYANGSLTFFNYVNQARYFNAGTAFPDNNGHLAAVITVQANMPPGSSSSPGEVTVSARAYVIGTAGNIAAKDIFWSSSTYHYGVANYQAFSGGKNAYSYKVVTQNDINAATFALKNAVTQGAQSALLSQAHTGEQLIGSMQCGTTVTHNQNPGSPASSVNVQVAVSCSGEVFNPQAAQAMAVNLLKHDLIAQLGASTTVVGNTVTNVIQATLSNNGVVVLKIATEGVGVFQFSNAQKQALIKLIAGKSQADARRLLLAQPEVGTAVIRVYDDINGTLAASNLPTASNNITLVVLSVPGLGKNATSGGLISGAQLIQQSTLPYGYRDGRAP